MCGRMVPMSGLRLLIALIAVLVSVHPLMRATRCECCSGRASVAEGLGDAFGAGESSGMTESGHSCCGGDRGDSTPDEGPSDSHHRGHGCNCLRVCCGATGPVLTAWPPSVGVWTSGISQVSDDAPRFVPEAPVSGVKRPPRRGSLA